jgi:hypothetical protein
VNDRILPERENVTAEIAEFAEVMQPGTEELTAEIAELAEVMPVWICTWTLFDLCVLCGESLARRDANAQP